MLAVVAYDPAVLPSGEAGREVPVLAAFARRHESVLACAERSAGEAFGLLAALGRVLPRFRFVALLADPGALQPVDVRVLAGLLDDGVVPVAVAAADSAGPVPVVPLAVRLAAVIGADVVMGLAYGADGASLQPLEWIPVPAAA